MLRWVRRGHVVLVDRGGRVPTTFALPCELLDDGHLDLGDERTGWVQESVLITPSEEGTRSSTNSVGELAEDGTPE